MKRDWPQKGAKKTRVQGYHAPLFFLRLFAATIFLALGLFGNVRTLAAEASLALAAELFAETDEAVKIAAGRVKFEASGGINIGTVKAIAETGVDLISLGALTHSAPILDLGLDIEIA